MTTTPTAQRVLMAAVLTALCMLVGAVPMAAQAQETSAQDERREVDGWIYGRGAATYSDATRQLSDDGWARGQGLRSQSRSTVDGWAVGQGLRSQQRSTIDGWSVGQGMRSQTTSATAPSDTAPAATPFPVEAAVTGLLLAAVIGAAGATLISHRRRPRSAH